jgi:Holliday junction resolvase-like predicted endonuclease
MATHVKPFRNCRKNREQTKHQGQQKTAAHCLQPTHWDNNVPRRFDAIATEGDPANACIDWIKNAFKT